VDGNGLQIWLREDRQVPLGGIWIAAQLITRTNLQVRTQRLSR
jgi:hypothetical protein